MGALDYDADLSIRGSGRPLVLVSGMDGTGKLFYRQAPDLADRHRVATYALRDAAGTMDALVTDLDAVVDAAAGEGAAATVFGESFGGAIALSYALAHPDRVVELAILNSFPHFGPQLRLRLGLAALKVMPWRAMHVVRRFTASRLHSSHTADEHIERFLEVTRETTLEGYRNRLRILTRYDVRDRLDEIDVPTLFLAAEEDHLVPSVEQAKAMATAVPDATLRVLEGHGHGCLLAPDVDLDGILREWRVAGGVETTAPGG
ncbi:MAG: alpha/beta hydrolase [Gemmatimonadota bacterium]|nr:alpha/beta hydrolase [Gemmatimonadota bacterium]